MTIRCYIQPLPESGDEIDLRSVANEPFVLLKKGCGIRRMADRLFAETGLSRISLMKQVITPWRSA